MRMSKQCVIFSLFILFICHGIAMGVDSPCGDWEPYKDEKCIKIIDETKTYDDAIKTCQQQENSSILISIRSSEKQEFLSNLLFKTHKVVDAIWVGAKYISNKFKWSDDTDVSFTNWAEGSPSNTTDKACVQMIAEGSSKGKWADEPCNKKNLIVCQKMQIWSPSQMQKIILSLMNNPVPVGFIYVQLPNQPEPKTLWPMAEWKNVGSDYAGHFFRVEGGNAASFGQSQPDAFQGHEHAPYTYDSYDSYSNNNPRPDYYAIVRSYTRQVDHILLSNGVNGQPRNASETRPINYSVRIWKRVS